MSKWKLAVIAGAAAFLAAGPVLNSPQAFASCGGIHLKGNNGFGNGGFDGVPGNSGNNGSPNAGQKTADQVR